MLTICSSLSMWHITCNQWCVIKKKNCQEWGSKLKITRTRLAARKNFVDLFWEQKKAFLFWECRILLAFFWNTWIKNNMRAKISFEQYLLDHLSTKKRPKFQHWSWQILVWTNLQPSYLSCFIGLIYDYYWFQLCRDLFFSDISEMDG